MVILGVFDTRGDISKTMRRRLSIYIVTVLMLLGALVVLTPQTAMAVKNCNSRFLTFPAWYNGLTNGDCNIVSPDSLPNGLTSFILMIATNMIEIVFQAVAYIAVGYILWGGFKYVTSYGESSEIVLARQRILNAIIGLVVAMLAVGIVKYVGSQIT